MKKTAVEEYPHTFHIPVMGTGFTVDTPLQIAKYGISSVISLVDDTLIEQMRKFHCEKEGEPYEAITVRQEDARARRITAYLDLLDRLVQRQTQALQAAPFEAGSEITRYYELLPDSPLKEAYADGYTSVEIRLAGRPEPKLAGRFMRPLPAGSRQLPSAALGYAAGGAIRTAVDDRGGTKAADPFFEIRVIPDEKSTAALLSGQRVIVRFSMAPKPLMVQWWRSLLQLLQRRFSI